MKFILPTAEQIAVINESRQHHAALMQQAGSPETPLMVAFGPCAADDNVLADGTFATEAHMSEIHEVALRLGEEDEPVRLVDASGRLVGTKSRTAKGRTGLIHGTDGALSYGRMACVLTTRGLPLASEIMDESDFAVASPWLTWGWAGARTNGDTGVRYLLRHTREEQENGISPRPAYVKSDQSGELTNAMNAIATILSTDERPRLRMGLNGPEHVTTIANPFVGLILRGGMRFLASKAPLADVLEEQVTLARDELEQRFDQIIPVGIDISHDNAKREGGGEDGELRVAEALIDLMRRGVIQIDLVMAETYILPGKQSETGTVPGLSTVDECIRQEKAIELLTSLYELQAEHRWRQLTLAGKVS